MGADDPHTPVARSPAHTPAAQGGADDGGRLQLVELAVVGRVSYILLASGAALASIAAAPEDKREQMLDAFDAVLNGMAYAGVGLCLFAIVWAGFVLMAEGAEGQGPGRGRAQQRGGHGHRRPGGGAPGQGHRRSPLNSRLGPIIPSP